MFSKSNTEKIKKKIIKIVQKQIWIGNRMKWKKNYNTEMRLPHCNNQHDSDKRWLIAANAEIHKQFHSINLIIVKFAQWLANIIAHSGIKLKHFFCFNLKKS